MPLPSRKKGEEKKAFVSRCVSDLSKKGEGGSQEQRVAICMSRANLVLTDSEKDAIASLWAASEVNSGKPVENLNPKKKKKKKDPYRATKKDGSGTDDSVASRVLRVSFENGHSHMVPEEALSGETSYDNGHVHAFRKTTDGSYVISEAHGHTHELYG